MRALSSLLLLAGALAQTPPSAASEAARVFVEWRAGKDTCFLGEPIELTLRLGCDREFFAAQAIQPFQQRLDVPLQLLAPWLDAPVGAVALPSLQALPAPLTPQRRIACNDGTTLALLLPEAEFDGRSFTVLELQRRFVATSAGELLLPPPRLHFAFATRFEDSLLQGRVPVDRQDVTVEGRRLTLRILPLPEAGRPRAFTGAVGSFAVSAEASPAQLPVGGELRLWLTVRGDGNLAVVPPPQLALPGFHLLSSSEQPMAGGRCFCFQLSPLRADLRQLPAIPFSFFDPTPPAGYRTVATEPIALAVQPPPPGARLAPLLQAEIDRARPGDNDIYELMPVPAATAAALPSSSGVLAALLLPWCLFALVFAWRRARARDLGDPLSVRARRAHATFVAAANAQGADLAAAMAEYLAARLRCPPAAVVASDLDQRLQAIGAPAALATAAAQQFEQLLQARYGGAADPSSRAAVLELVRAIEAALVEGGRQ